MPEGHKIHRIAAVFRQDFARRTVQASSPQGRFAEGAALIDGRRLRSAAAEGKNLLLDFGEDRWVRIHLGLYGIWDFAGWISLLPDNDPRVSTEPIGGRGTVRPFTPPGRAFPPPPVGQVRLRLQVTRSLADLRGPTSCELLSTAEKEEMLAPLGPDPLSDRFTPAQAEQEFLGRVSRRGTPIAQLLMDQHVVGGIGNIYRAEMLFRARIDPLTPGRVLTEEQIVQLWQDWVHLLGVGVRTGLMLTMDGLDEDAERRALASRADRHWVYRRAGEPCRICTTPIALATLSGRKLYWCPSCQSS